MKRVPADPSDLAEEWVVALLESIKRTRAEIEGLQPVAVTKEATKPFPNGAEESLEQTLLNLQAKLDKLTQRLPDNDLDLAQEWAIALLELTTAPRLRLKASNQLQSQRNARSSLNPRENPYTRLPPYSMRSIKRLSYELRRKGKTPQFTWPFSVGLGQIMAQTFGTYGKPTGNPKDVSHLLDLERLINTLIDLFP